MNAFRLGLAIVAGTVFISVIAFCADAVAAGVLTVFPFLDLALAFPYGICGGLVAARLAPGKEIFAGAGVALLNVAVGLTSYLINGGGQALWFWVAMTASVAAGAIFGAHLRALQVAKRRRFEKKKSRSVAR